MPFLEFDGGEDSWRLIEKLTIRAVKPLGTVVE